MDTVNKYNPATNYLEIVYSNIYDMNFQNILIEIFNDTELIDNYCIDETITIDTIVSDQHGWRVGLYFLQNILGITHDEEGTLIDDNYDYAIDLTDTILDKMTNELTIYLESKYPDMYKNFPRLDNIFFVYSEGITLGITLN